MEIVDLLISLEKQLQSADVRSSKQKLDTLLSDNFTEIGASGIVYSKNDIIKRLIKSTIHEMEATDFKLTNLSAGIMQLIYREKSKLSNTEVRYTISSSLWKKTGTHWQMIFHQGTVAIDENKYFINSTSNAESV